MSAPVFAFSLLVLLAAPLGGAPPVAPGDDLVGLWATETTIGPQIRGELTVLRGPTRWTARIGGFEIAWPVTGDTVRVALPGGQGELRARLIDGGRAIRGF